MTDDQEAGLVACGACGSVVLPRNHCSVCGEALLAAEPDATLRGRPRRARDGAIRLATTLFPRLPRADLDAFRLALGDRRACVVVVLAAAGFLPVALLASALLVPLLLTVYLYSTDVYEDEPVRVILVTLAWGAVTGALFGLLLRELFPARVGPPADESLEVLVAASSSCPASRWRSSWPGRSPCSAIASSTTSSTAPRSARSAARCSWARRSSPSRSTS